MANFLDSYIANLVPALKFGAAYSQGMASKNAGDYNAQQRSLEGTAALEQSLNQEVQQRRIDRQALGRQAAAIGGAHIGYGGSSGRVMAESAANAELDALNIRYRGQFTKSGYDQEAALAKYQGETGLRNNLLRAGASLLTGKSSNYAPVGEG